jgi:hypothetical protein
MNRVRLALRNEVPELSGYFQSGGLVDSVLNLGLPAPIDVQVSGMNLENTYQTAIQIAKQIRQASNPGTSSITGKILAISRLGGGNCASSNKRPKRSALTVSGRIVSKGCRYSPAWQRNNEGRVLRAPQD